MNAESGLWDGPADPSDIVRSTLKAAALGLAKSDDAWLGLGALSSALGKISVSLGVEQNEGSYDLAVRLGAGLEEPKLVALLIDLFSAAKLGGFQLRRCFADGLWFSPGLRSARSKFCSVRCRNRFNYEVRSGATFVCSHCNEVRKLSSFSGLANFSAGLVPADVHSAQPFCVICISATRSDWAAYMETAEVGPTHELSRTSRAAYLDDINVLLKQALLQSETPLHYSKVAAYVRQHCDVRGQSPDLTILGYLLRNSTDFTQVSKHVFALANKSTHRKSPGRNRESA
jgi:hypothetical protein